MEITHQGEVVMSRGKLLSLEEARNEGKIKQFATEHPSKADERFGPLLDAMCKGKLPKRTKASGQTSSAVASEDCSDTRIP